MSFEASVVRSALAGLETLIVGREVLAFDALPSTNTLLREYAEAGAAEGLVAVADQQTAGRGRRGRSWNAPPGTNLLQSILLRPTWLEPHELWLLTALAAVALHDAIKHALDVETQLKWPNDLLLGNRKLSGILVEGEIREQRIAWAIIGCGINVNWYPAGDADLATTTISLAEHLNHPVQRAPLLSAFLRALDQQYLALRSGRREALRSRWMNLLVTLGQQVSVEIGDAEVIYGTAETVELDGALRIRLEDQSVRRVFAGDVRVRKA